MSNLGNVFRNLKWTDLQVQNIKTSLVNHKLYFILTIVFSLFALFFITPYLPYALRETISNLTLSFTLLSNSFTCFISMNYIIVQYFFNHFFTNTEKLVASHMSTEHYELTTKQQTTLLGQGVDTRITPVIQSMYRLSNQLTLFNNEQAILQATQKTLNFEDPRLAYNLRILYPQLFNSGVSQFDDSNLYSTLDKSFIPNAKNTLKYDKVNNYQLTVADLNTIGSDQHTLLTNMLNLNESSHTLKQTRWALKNSFISEDLMKFNNDFLNSKRLFDVSLSDAKATDSNIWLSSYLTNSSFNYTPTSTNTNDNFNLLKLNNFEESQTFIMNRYLNMINLNNLNPVKVYQPLVNNVETSSDRSVTSFFYLQEAHTKFVTNSELLLLPGYNQQSLLNNTKSTQNPSDFALTSAPINVFASDLNTLLSNITTSTSSHQLVVNVNKNLK